jgi:hypothetical protein
MHPPGERSIDINKGQNHHDKAYRHRYARADTAVRPYAEDLFNERSTEYGPPTIKYRNQPTRRRVECGAGVPGAGHFSRRGVQARDHSASVRAGTVLDGQNQQIVTK